MSFEAPAAADQKIAEAVFADHVTRVEAGEQARDHGWTFARLDPLHVVVAITVIRPAGERDDFYVKLGGEYYDQHPPTTVFVSPPRLALAGTPAREYWTEAPTGSRWLPIVDPLPWFAIHPVYPFPDGKPRQLVCCSMTLEYYISNHSPTPGQRWQQGRHTMGATLNRIQDALTSPNYKGPSGALDS